MMNLAFVNGSGTSRENVLAENIVVVQVILHAIPNFRHRLPLINQPGVFADERLAGIETCQLDTTAGIQFDKAVLKQHTGRGLSTEFGAGNYHRTCRLESTLNILFNIPP